MTTCRVADCGATTDAFCCRSCAAELRRALQNHHRGDPDVPTLMAALSQSATGSARVYRANRRPGQPDEELAELEEAIGWQHDATPARLRSKQGRVTLPATGGVVNMAARDLLDEAWSALTTTVRHLLEHRGVDNPFTPDSNPRQIADWLADRVNAIRYDDAGPDIHADLIRLRERLIRAVDRGPSRVYAGPCERFLEDGGKCDRPLYAWFNVWRADADTEEAGSAPLVVCDGYRPPSDPQWDPTDKGCGAEHTPADRGDWIIAEMDGRLDTLTFWQHWLPLLLPKLAWPNRSTWWRWREGNRLEVKSINRDAQEMFRGGDVIDLVMREQPRIRGNQGKARAGRGIQRPA